MGADYTAVAIIGTCVYTHNIPKLKKTVKRPAFNHDKKYSEHDNFHPKTGAKLWLDETKEVDSDIRKYVIDSGDEVGHAGVLETMFEKGKLTYKLLSPFEGRIRCFKDYEDEEKTWVGLVLDNTNSNCGTDHEFTVIPPDVKEVVQALLEPYGLWNEANYGLHAVLACSC